MKRSYRPLLSLSLLLVIGIQVASAQATPTKQPHRNILEALETPAPGEGVVTIIQSPELRRLIGVQGSASVLGRDGNYTLLMGYRVQMFNSNRSGAKAEAYARAEQIRHIAPTMSSYITYKAPFWRLAVGNFATREEANQARARLVSTLPAWAQESYVVRDKVRILNYTEPNTQED